MTGYVDRRFRHIGRIKKAYGTDHRPTQKSLNQMLDGLFERGRFDILRAIKKGEYTLLEVWNYYRLNELHRLPTAALLAPLESTFEEWIDRAETKGKDVSEKHKDSLRQSLRYLIGVSRAKPTVGDIPVLLIRLRSQMKADGISQSFNKARSACQAFVRSTLKRTHPLWGEITEIETLAVTQKQLKRPQTVEAVRELVKALGAKHGPSAWAMAVTGMGPSEYWGKWHIEKDRIHIDGTKRSGRVRDVPLVERIARPYATPKAFAERMKEINAQCTPYDFRRSYANWMEKAKIDRTNRRLYMGHKAKDVLDLYEDHQLVTRILHADAETLRKYIGSATEGHGLKLEKAG